MIDSSFMYNIYGIVLQLILNIRKEMHLISIISDEINNIISLNYDKTHLSRNNNPSFSHDVKLVQKNLDDTLIKLPSNKIVKLCGDKGYITKKRVKLNNDKRVYIISPKRKNQKTENTSQDKNILKKRHNVERSLSAIKKFNRITIRKDKLIENYMGFVYMGLISSFFNRNLKQ